MGSTFFAPSSLFLISAMSHRRYS